MGNLHKKKCIACSGDTPALSETEIITFNKQINNWNSIKNQDGIFMLSKYFKFKNFEESLLLLTRPLLLRRMRDIILISHLVGVIQTSLFLLMLFKV